MNILTYQNFLKSFIKQRKSDDTLWLARVGQQHAFWAGLGNGGICMGSAQWVLMVG
jgi:hypothetical protein